MEGDTLATAVRKSFQFCSDVVFTDTLQIVQIMKLNT